MQKHIHAIAAAVLLTGFGDSASAAGFALIEQSASGMGNAYAGAAANAEDASTVYFNPAGMIYLPDNQLVLAGHAIRLSAEFSNNGSHLTNAIGGTGTRGGNGGDAGSLALLPNLYYARSIAENIRIGLGINTPFGLKTEYDSSWIGRYQALKSELKSININPSIAFKANDRLSLGFGISAMQMQADLTNAVDFGSLRFALSGGLAGTRQGEDGFLRVKGSDWGWGWNAGLLFQPSSDTRVGLAYRSQVHQALEGSATFSNVPASLSTLFPNGGISAKLTTPDTLSASVFHQLNARWDIMADATWTQWSKFQNLTIVRSTGAVLGSTPENWENTMRYSVGASYHYSDALKLRAGVAYDESPVPDNFRTARMPDNDRTWLSLGASYKCAADSTLDVGYTHIFVKNTSINKTNDSSIPALRDVLIGSYDTDVNILSVQFSHMF